MKKIFALLVCTLLLLCAFPVAVFAEESPTDSIETTVEVEDTTPTEETAPKGEISGEKNTPKITTEAIKEYIKSHFEEVSVVVSLIVSAFYSVRKHKLINKSISATNHNAITVAEKSELALAIATERVEAFSALFDKYQKSEEDKVKLEQTLNEAMSYIKASKLANIEFANELAELLVLANIPNSKKDELYSRHIAAVNAIAEAEKSEVITDDGKEA